MPFAVTAKQGDTLHYIWGGNMHSVTESDGQNVCNKSTTAEAFDSGVCECLISRVQDSLTEADRSQRDGDV